MKFTTDGRRTFKGQRKSVGVAESRADRDLRNVVGAHFLVGLARAPLVDGGDAHDAAVLQRQLDGIAEGNGSDRWVNRPRQSRNRQQPRRQSAATGRLWRANWLILNRWIMERRGFESHPVLDTTMTQDILLLYVTQSFPGGSESGGQGKRSLVFGGCARAVRPFSR